MASANVGQRRVPVAPGVTTAYLAAASPILVWDSGLRTQVQESTEMPLRLCYEVSGDLIGDGVVRDAWPVIKLISQHKLCSTGSPHTLHSRFGQPSFLEVPASLYSESGQASDRVDAVAG